MSSPRTLTPISWYVTGHNEADGESVFHSDINTTPPVRKQPDNIQIFDCYLTQGFPIDLSGDKDIRTYEHLLQNPPGIVVPNGSAARVVDIPPGYTSPMHRSMSLNYNFVIEGEVDAILSSGEVRTLKRGDGIVQRAINHAWRNNSQTEWARITAVVLPVQPFQVGPSKGNASGAQDTEQKKE
ncbi:uncharacterized protein A1O9_07268 [Exophiala aquamarina CBS 119918]|uniref:Cupin type-2 domain-containing protein n=1 Tax=Exophiala aquamarina CBS 119918 TaxID=1182545 RepID=A0A072PCQ7_9EURO|nr:uncharacterized protein A1O9_07268 [Exophiala aquamarina CBS 119918]KEF57078.1 hypothetical protein A1O9_07268 [Exophiala aquamarina CBS 119918]